MVIDAGGVPNEYTMTSEELEKKEKEWKGREVAKWYGNEVAFILVSNWYVIRRCIHAKILWEALSQLCKILHCVLTALFLCMHTCIKNS